MPFFKVPNAMVANTVNNKKPNLLGATKAIAIIAAAQRIDCVMIIFALLIFSFLFPLKSCLASFS